MRLPAFFIAPLRRRDDAVLRRLEAEARRFFDLPDGGLSGRSPASC
jgi:hypothetical protein